MFDYSLIISNLLAYLQRNDLLSTNSDEAVTQLAEICGIDTETADELFDY